MSSSCSDSFYDSWSDTLCLFLVSCVSMFYFSWSNAKCITVCSTFPLLDFSTSKTSMYPGFHLEAYYHILNSFSNRLAMSFLLLSRGLDRDRDIGTMTPRCLNFFFFCINFQCLRIDSELCLFRPLSYAFSQNFVTLVLPCEF